ncbi:hypothetical protein ACEZCY_14110 [Streptacidiphilus sp. N1-12]|uniref:Uncharacterized protein n=2 Tax=Streptacidiphilus alkalitolerans TaxID=3342712 RepID=A0ABV6V9R7_9ACTN
MIDTEQETPTLEVEPVAQRVLAMPTLRPYLPGRATGRMLAAGSRVMWCIGWRWLTGSGWRTGLHQAGGVGLGVYVAAYLDLHVTPFLAPAAVALWVGGAIYYAPAARVAGPAAGAEPLPEEPEGEPFTVEEVAALVRQIAAEHGWLGVHLDDLLTALPGVSRTDLLDVLAEGGIPVAEQLKIRLPGGRSRNRRGVRLSALPPGLGEAPAAAPSGGPQSAPLPPLSTPPTAPS